MTKFQTEQPLIAKFSHHIPQSNQHPFPTICSHLLAFLHLNCFLDHQRVEDAPFYSELACSSQDILHLIFESLIESRIIFNTCIDMRHDLLPPRGATGGTPKKPTNAPAKVVAGHLMNKLGRPSRSRSRLLLSLILATSIFGLLLGRRHSVGSLNPCYVQRVTDCS
jgi:hypothetical protein